MRVLVACEHSDTVAAAFRRHGHHAHSCDVLPTTGDPAWHLQCDVRELLGESYRWDLMIAHPPCTYLAVSGLHWNKRRPERAAQTDEALAFFRTLLAAPIPRIAIENPVGAANTMVRKPDQIIQPWQYGHRESKATCLWLRGLPLLRPTQIMEPAAYQENGRPRWDNMTPSGQNKLGPSPDRWARRSKTYQGIADAMASQWGNL